MSTRELPKISIIIPVYNSEKHLGRCIESILKQTFQDFELLLIDDGSTDNSSNICEEYGQRDNRIVVVHKENGGTSDARNKGLDVARGEFVMFCDNDDVVAENWIEILYKYAVKNPNSLVNCEYAKINMKTGEKTEIKLPNVVESRFFSKDEYYFLYSNSYILYIWNRIYKLETIRNNNFRFNVSMKKGGEDILFNLSYIDTCENFYHINKCLYFWIDNGASVSRNYEAHYYSVIKELYFPRLN